MYARSYEKSPIEEADLRTLPSGYCGVTFENEEDVPPPPPPIEDCPAQAQASPASLLFSKIPFLEKLRPKGSLIGSLFSDTEDLLLIGIFFLLLFSKEGDPLCAGLVLFLFFVDKF